MAAPLSERFERSVDRSGMHHLWLGATNPARGTGRLKVDGRDITAHRVAWELAHGPLGPGGRVLPCRDEPRCVRVEHLRLDALARVRSTRAARGTGSKRQRRPGVWELTVTVATDGLGGTRRVFRTFNGGQRDASRALAELVAEVGDGSDLPSQESKGLTFEGVLDQFLDHLRDNKDRRHSTLVRYRGLADRWIVPAIGSTIAERLRSAELEDLLGRMRIEGQSQSSIHQAFTLLNGACKWARRCRLISRNPMVDVEEPRSSQAKHEVVPPDLDRLRTLLDHALSADPEFGLVCRLGAITGMRRGEIAGLRWNRVDLDRGRLEVTAVVNDAGGAVVVHESTKTGVRRAVDIDPATAELLRAHRHAMARRASAVGRPLAPHAFVFSHAPVCDHPIRPEYLTRRMRQLRRELGLDDADTDTTLHALRHWTQTTLTEAGYDSRQVAARGGHSEQVMKRVYVHRTAHAEAEMTLHVGRLLSPTEESTRPPAHGG